MEPLKGKTAESSGSGTVCTKQQRIAELAKQSPRMVLTTLAHHMDLEWLREAYERTRKDGAAGVDGQTGANYAANLEENLRSLLERAKSGLYKAPPVRRVYIPKGTGRETRPLGIPTFEDKVLQRAVVMLLEPVYEVAAATTVRTDSGPTATPTRRWPLCGKRPCGTGVGFWRSIYASSSIDWTTNTFGRFSARG